MGLAVVGCGDSSSDDSEVDAGADMSVASDASEPVDGFSEEDAFVPTDAGTCDSPGSTETISCGMCGTQERFCTAGGTWELLGACTGMGVCEPGTTEDRTCGMCGTRIARCTSTCQWEEDAECMDEGGVCEPGTREAIQDGCPGGEWRETRCTESCEHEEILGCGTKPEIDVMVVVPDRLETSVSERPEPGAGFVQLAMGLRTDVTEPLFVEFFPGFHMGIVSYGDFPVGPYGRDEDTALFRHSEPLDNGVVVSTRFSNTRSASHGADLGGSGIEALWSVAGGTPHPEAQAATACEAGREGGWACWRPRSRRVVIFFADLPQHGGPDLTGGIWEPYAGISPSPATWADTVAQVRAANVEVVMMVETTNRDAPSIDAVDQLQAMAADLGVRSEHLLIYDRAGWDTARANLVTLIGDLVP